MAKLVNPISPSVAEQLRANIASILADEIANQAVLLPTDLAIQNVKVEEERFSPINVSELSLGQVVIVRFVQGQRINHDQTNQFNEYTFFIDVYSQSVSSIEGNAHQRSAKDLHRLVFLINAILASPYYIKLDTTGFGSKRMESINVSDLEDNMDSNGTVMCRITYTIKASENFEYQAPSPLNESQTTFGIGETGKSFQTLTDTTP